MRPFCCLGLNSPRPSPTHKVQLSGQKANEPASSPVSLRSGNTTSTPRLETSPSIPQTSQDSKTSTPHSRPESRTSTPQSSPEMRTSTPQSSEESRTSTLQPSTELGSSIPQPSPELRTLSCKPRAELRTSTDMEDLLHDGHPDGMTPTSSLGHSQGGWLEGFCPLF